MGAAGRNNVECASAALGARASRPPTEPKGWYSRGYLPHVDAPDLVQAITFRLADSLPASVMARFDDLDPAVRRRALDGALDRGHGGCLLRSPLAAAIVENAFLCFDGERYRLLAWVVMPNHVHCVIETTPAWPVYRVVQGWKSFTAKAINGAMARHGRVWQPEYFDRFIRDDVHLAAVIRYVEENPVKAGLVRNPSDWPFGSAAMRAGRPRSQDAGAGGEGFS